MRTKQPQMRGHEALLRRIALVSAPLGAVALLLAFAALRNGDRDRACDVRAFEGSRFVVCVVDALRHDVRLAARDAAGNYLRSFQALEAFLGPEAQRVRFAMNAGMYDDRGAPIGLYISDGDEAHALSLTEGPGNFHMKPNGVFWQDADGDMHVDTSEQFAPARPLARLATQSGPMLVIDGELHREFAHDGASRNIRNGVGVRDANTAYFVLSSGPVSFGRFARCFRDELGCPNALFLDGAVSSLWRPETGQRDDTHALGPMIVALNRR